jgi:hypothetical protein
MATLKPCSFWKMGPLGVTWSVLSTSGPLERRKEKTGILQDQRYRLNAYRFLLTRARQGLAIVVREGNLTDHTIMLSFYDLTWMYLQSIGLQEL